MKTILSFSLLLATAAHAQWKTETIALKGGWNAIYLHGAPHGTVDAQFAAGDGLQVQEVWRWNPNPNQVQFSGTPLLPLPGTPEWSLWKRGFPAESTLPALTGQSAYLVKCAGTAASNWSVNLKLSPQIPGTTWVRHGANLLGFPTFKNGANFPTFSGYFATFPAAIAPSTKIFRYAGGDLSPANPLQIFSPAVERVDRNLAYWFDSEVVGNFYAPIEVELSTPGGLEFGRTTSVITAHVRNRTSAPVTLTIAPVNSESAPAGAAPVTGAVPLMRRVFNTGTASWNETPLTAAYTEVLAPQANTQLYFGINRGAMSGASSFYASLLRLTESSNLMDVYLPARAQVASLQGLWIGEAEVGGDGTAGGVESKVAGYPGTKTARTFPLRYILHVADDGTTRLLSQAFMGKLTLPANPIGICTKEVGLLAAEKKNATRVAAAHLPLDQVITTGEPGGAATVALGSTLKRNIVIPFNDPVNPFVHQYHPDHNNKDPRLAALPAGKESFDITRKISFAFTAAPPAGVSSLGWGTTVIGGNYTEVITGIHKQDITVTGTFVLRRASDIGSITVN